MEDNALLFAICYEQQWISETISGCRKSGIPAAWTDWLERLWDMVGEGRRQRRVDDQLGLPVDFNAMFIRYGSVRT